MDDWRDLVSFHRKTLSQLRLVLGLLGHNKMALKQLYTQDAVGNNCEGETKR